MTETQINFLEPILQSAWISNITDDDGVQVIGLSLLGYFKDGVDFKNTLLNAYKNNLLIRVSEFCKLTGYAKLKEIQHARPDYIRENQELCATWASFIIEARCLNTLLHDGGTLDDFCLTDRLLINEFDDESVIFV
ncbi:MAG: hypothetical protein Q8Q40_03005 [Methylococcaceae bacterium]|nr:hypothetical protein [Methylococcaceae bacterium]MDP3902928.1 hypothetical protein [Methylococcaceae bacterium]